MSWNIAQAKQRFSEIVRRTSEGPQLIYNRKRLVAAVIDSEDYRAFIEWSERNEPEFTVGAAFCGDQR